MEGVSATGRCSGSGEATHALATRSGGSVSFGASRPRVAGWIDLAHVRAEVARTLPSDSPGEIKGPGFSMLGSGDGTDVFADESNIVLLVGSPTVQGRRVRAAEVAAAGDTPQLGGRFAAVILDRAAKKAELRTDRFGALPLCWAREGQRLAFSDRADCVPTLAPSSLDPQALFEYVYFHMIPSPRTVFQGVFRMEPATALSFDASGLSMRRWWQPRFSTRRQGAPAELAARFLNVLKASVSSESTSGNVGCYLSGGTDSSTVAGMLKATTGAAASFSIGFDEEGYDEMAYARIAARHFGTQHHEHYVTPAELVASIPSVAAHYDQPFGNSSAVPAFICARTARENGIEKLLAGDGGDELFGGNSRYARQKIFEAWWRLPGSLRGMLATGLGTEWARDAPIIRKAASYVEQARTRMPDRMETYNLLNRFGHGSVFRADFLRRVDQEAPEQLQRSVYSQHAAAPFVDRMMAYDWRFTLADNDLPKVCGTAQLAHVDVGFPLLADELVDLALQLAPSDKVRGLRLRHFFKEALVGFLPPEIIAKKKHGFGLPVGKWLLKDEAFRALARDSLSELAGRRLILPTFVDDLFSRRLEEHPGYYGEMIWVLMMLEQWLSARCPSWRAD